MNDNYEKNLEYIKSLGYRLKENVEAEVYHRYKDGEEYQVTPYMLEHHGLEKLKDIIISMESRKLREENLIERMEYPHEYAVIDLRQISE